MLNHKKVKGKSTGAGEKKVKSYSTGSVANNNPNKDNDDKVHSKYGATGDGFKSHSYRKTGRSKKITPAKKRDL
jgi:hypothetical protein